jgi:hypothetical protein
MKPDRMIITGGAYPTPSSGIKPSKKIIGVGLVEYSLRSVDLCFEIGTLPSSSDICNAVLMEMH